MAPFLVFTSWGGIGGTAEQRVGNAHLDEHGAEVVALAQRGAALIFRHLALAELDHLGDHLIHAGIGGRIKNLETVDVETALCGGSLDFFHIADKDRGEEAALFQTGSRFQNTGIGSFGEDDLAGICLEDFYEIFKHENASVTFNLITKLTVPRRDRFFKS